MMTETTHQETQYEDLLTRDGHLTELTLNRFLNGELDAFPQIREHVDTCPVCAQTLDSVRAFDASFAIAPPGPPALTATADEPNVVSLADERRRRAPVAVIVAAAAAVVLALVAWPSGSRSPVGGDDDGIRIKGSGLTLLVFAKSGDNKPRPVTDNDVVHAGDRLGFRISSRDAGFAMIVGVDDEGVAYPAWPQDGARAAFVEASTSARDIDAAILLDDRGASERLALVRCPDSFSWKQAAELLTANRKLSAKPGGTDPLARCVYDDLTLRKEPR